MAELLASDPTTIGPYRLINRIGTGGMGVVYLVLGPDGSQAALKLIRAELADDPAFRARFRREVEAGQRVGGVCNAKYLAADLDAERPYLVTEFVPGGNLADFVATNGPLPGDQAVSLAVGLAEALVAMSSVDWREWELVQWLDSLAARQTSRAGTGLFVGLLGDANNRAGELDWTVKQFLGCAQRMDRNFVWHWMAPEMMDDSEWLTDSVTALLTGKKLSRGPAFLQEMAFEGV